MQFGRCREVMVEARGGRRGRRRSGVGKEEGMQTEDTLGREGELRRHEIARGGGGGFSIVKRRGPDLDVN
jgi:hypothetical protein